MNRMDNERQTGKCHVLLIYREMIPSIRLCGHSQLQALADQGRIEYRAVQEMQLSARTMSWADTVILGRLDNWYEEQLARVLHRAGRRLVYILDDDLLNIPPAISSASYYSQKVIQDNIRSMIAMSDAIMSPSPLLLEKYAVDGREAVRMEEPALGSVPYAPHYPGAPVRIGFAGSIDRTSDVESILGQALLQVKEKYGDRVSFGFIGALPSFARQLDATCVAYLDSYDEYRERLNGMKWDIGLAPMPDTPFHNCKHYNKFCEYAAAGIAGIYSDCPPYTFIPNREAVGRFCRNDSREWFEQICAEIDDAATRESHRRHASEYANTALNPVHIARELFKDHPLLFAPRRGDAVAIAQWQLIWLKMKGFMLSTAEKVRRYGIRFPAAAVKKLYSKARMALKKDKIQEERK